MLKKVAQAKARSERRHREALDTRDAKTKQAALLRTKQGNTKQAIEERRRLKLGELAHSKPSDNGGMNYAVDARKQRKADKPDASKWAKPSDFGTRTATAGSKTDASINSYYRNKRGDNMPRTRK